MSSYDVAPLARLEPDYLARYDLQTAPFSSTHDDRFLYLDGEHQQLLNMLHHLTRYSQLMLIVVGERGSGKTSIKQRFVNQADDGYLICEVDAHPMMDADELLSSIAQGFGLLDIPASPAELQNNLYRYLAGLQQQDRVPVLLVDDAHELPQDALEALFYLSDAEAGEGNLLRTVLFCEPAIDVMLESSAIGPLKERVTHHMRLPPFDEEQTAEYLRHRLAVAGLEGASPFTPREVRRIHKSSGGIPERINDAAHQLLAGGKVEDMAAYDDDEADEEGMPRAGWLSHRYILAGVGGVVLLGAVLWWQDEINQLFDPAPPEAASPIATEPTIEAPPSGSISKPAKPDPETTPKLTPAPPQRVVEFGPDGTTDSTQNEPVSEESAADATESPETPQSRVEAQPTATDQANGQTPPATTEAPMSDSAEIKAPSPQPDAEQKKPADEPSVPDSPALQIDRLEPEPVPASDKPQTLSLFGSGFSDATRITVEWGNQRKTLPESRLTLVSDQQLDFWITVGQQPEKWLVIARNPQGDDAARTSFTVQAKVPSTGQAASSEPSQTAPDKQDDASQDDLDWLQRQPAEYFTLQLLAARQRDNLREFLQRHKLADQAVIFESRDNGKPWYAVAYGSYPDRSAAQQAASDLPAGIEPWIRPFADVQSVLPPPEPEAITDKPIPRSATPQDHAAWLWNQDPAAYTLQLIAGRNEPAIQAFIDRHGLRGEAVFYQTRRDGERWYVVVQGSYADRQAALAARKALPAVLQQQSPWPRPFSEVHADLYRN